MTLMSPRMIQMGQKHESVASHLEAVGGEAEFVVTDGERTMTMMSPRMIQIGTET